jgi:phenylacetate-CoA ligase
LATAVVCGQCPDKNRHAGGRLADAIRERLRAVLVVQMRVDLVPWGSLQRSEYKSKLVERS